MQLSDLFYSIQGEGGFYGTATVFIRFFDCNLACEFCDEPLHKTRSFTKSIEEILLEVQRHPTRFVVMTGGEPSLHDRTPLIKLLQSKGYHIAAETNGYAPENLAGADWITYSPKDLKQVRKAPFFDELKVIVGESTPEADLLDLSEWCNRPIYLQPERRAGDKELTQANIFKTRDLILKYPRFRLSLQTQRYINLK